MPYVYQPRVPGRKRTIFKVARSSMPALRGAGVRSGWKSKTALKKLVKKMVAGQAETKYVADQYNKNAGAALPNVWDVNSLGVGALKFLPMIPQVSQGTDDNERVGDTITPSGKIKTTLNFAINDDVSGSQQILVTIYYGTTKDRKSWESQNPLSTASFLDNGDGTNTGPTYTRVSAMLPTQKDLVTFKKKQFVLSKATGFTGGDAGTGNYAANAGRSYRSITLTAAPPKKLKYSVGNDTYPVNFAPGYFIQLAYADGAVPASGANLDRIVNVTSRNHMWFKDM